MNKVIKILSKGYTNTMWALDNYILAAILNVSKKLGIKFDKNQESTQPVWLNFNIFTDKYVVATVMAFLLAGLLCGYFYTSIGIFSLIYNALAIAVGILSITSLQQENPVNYIFTAIIFWAALHNPLTCVIFIFSLTNFVIAKLNNALVAKSTNNDKNKTVLNREIALLLMGIVTMAIYCTFFVAPILTIIGTSVALASKIVPMIIAKLKYHFSSKPSLLEGAKHSETLESRSLLKEQSNTREHEDRHQETQLQEVQTSSSEPLQMR